MAVLSAAYAVCITIIVLEVVVIGALAAYLKLPKPSESGKKRGIIRNDRLPPNNSSRTEHAL